MAETPDLKVDLPALVDAEPSPTAEPSEFTMGKSEVGGPDVVADGPGTPIVGVIVLVVMILWIAGQELYGIKKKKDEHQPKDPS